MRAFKWVIDKIKNLILRLRNKRQEYLIRRRVQESRNTPKYDIDQKIRQLIASAGSSQEADVLEIIQQQTAMDLGIDKGNNIGIPYLSKGKFDLVEIEQEINKINLKLFEISLKERRIDPVHFPQSYPTDRGIDALEQSFQEHDGKKNLIFVPSGIDKLKNRFGNFEKFLQENVLVRIYRTREDKIRQEEEVKKQQVKELIRKIENLINQGDLQQAPSHIVKVTTSISVLRNSDQKKFFREKLETLKEKFRERQIREEAKRQAEELRKRQQESESIRIAEEAKREEERKQREQQAQIQKQQENEAKRKEEEKIQARLHLLTKKSNWQEFADVLIENNISKLYHFTEKANIRSIKEEGGLFSWHYCDVNNILIPKTGGNTLSRDLDRRHKLGDFVRLSFCSDHPMQFRLSQQGYNLVVLEVSCEVAFFENTRFSDINATDNGHLEGASLKDLKRVRFSATKKKHLRKDDPDFKFQQAEVMVKTWIPIEYITNINQF
jgi:hypothetical protein